MHGGHGSGVFWVKATLAALGGGFGMVGGMMVLGGVIFLPAIAVAGYFAYNKIKSAHEKAMAQKEKARRFERESTAYFAELDRSVRFLREMNYGLRTAAEFFQRVATLSLVAP